MAARTPEAALPLPEGWIKCASKSMQGKEYYFNKLTGESLWEHPEKDFIENQVSEKKEESQSVQTNEPRKVQSEGPVEVVASKRAALNPLAPFSRKRTKSDAILKENTTSGKLTEVKDIRKVESKKESCSSEQKGKLGIQQWISEVSKTENGFAKVASTKATSYETALNNASTDNSLGLRHKAADVRSLNDSSNKAVGIAAKIKGSRSKEVFRNNRPSPSKSLPPLKPLKRTIKRQTIAKMVESPSRVISTGYKIPKSNINSKAKSRGPDRSQHQAAKPGMEKNPHKNTGLLSISHNSGNLASFGPNLNNQRVPDLVSNPSSSTWSDSAMTVLVGSDVNGDPSAQQPLDDASCEDMEVDDVEFMQRKIFQEIEGMRLQKISVPQPANNVETQELMNIPQATLYIVVDTNILLSHLKFVLELKDHPIPGAGRPILVIPWMVMQELDRLKEAPDTRVHEFSEESDQSAIGVNVLARRAVAFLNSCFTESHPRVRGQTLVEASQSVPGMVEETNDDSILSCCLLYQNKTESSKTVLLSNDRNLCNKAIVNGVKAFPKKTLLSSLRDLLQTGSLIVHEDHFQEYFEEAGIQQALAERRKKADDLKCELQCILREAFAAVIEKEMEEAFGDIWLEIVKIRPPWTLIDTLQLIERHWIAVFGQIIKRNLKDQVVILKKKFSCGDGTSQSLLESRELIDLGFVLCDAFSKRSDYNSVMPKCLAAVTVLQRKCKEFLADASPALISGNGNCTDAAKLSRVENRVDANEISNCVRSVLHENDSAVVPTTPTECGEVSLHFGVMSTFDAIWKAVTTLSSTIFDSLQYPNPYSDGNIQSETRRSKEEARRFLQLLVPCLEQLVQAIQVVLACPLESSMERVNIFDDLGECIAIFMKKIMCQDCKITLNELRSFCLDNSSRSALIQGLSQLDRAFAMLQHCLSCALR